uniref:Uncharacterized protein n=1 Tax=Tetranychus urticae TaxID=32264 RepID=T1KQB0_TETUR
MPICKDQVLILNNYDHSREPTLEETKCPKFTALDNYSTRPTITPWSQAKTQNNQTSINESANPWGPMFKDRSDFIDAHFA